MQPLQLTQLFKIWSEYRSVPTPLVTNSVTSRLDHSLISSDTALLGMRYSLTSNPFGRTNNITF